MRLPRRSLAFDVPPEYVFRAVGVPPPAPEGRRILRGYSDRMVGALAAATIALQPPGGGVPQPRPSLRTGVRTTAPHPASTPTAPQPVDEIATVDKLLCVSQRVAMDQAHCSVYRRRERMSSDRARRDNVLIVHWHDLGRYLGAYGHADVSSPRLDQLAAEGILFTRAHATAPLCSPSRGSLVHRPLPAEQRPGRPGPSRLGVPRRRPHAAPHPVRIRLVYSAIRHAARDVVSVEARIRRIRRVELLLRIRRRARHARGSPTRPRAVPAHRGLLRNPPPYPRDRYEPADAEDVVVPDYLPDTDDIRQDLAEFYGSISVADAAVGQLLDTLAAPAWTEPHGWCS